MRKSLGENRQIILNDQPVNYLVKNSRRAKHLRITVYKDCSVFVTIPRRCTMNAAESFLRTRADWIFKKIAYFQQFVGETKFKANDQDFIKYRQEALALAQNQIAYLNRDLKLPVTKIVIKNLKSKWGSCSNRGVLTFSYLIALLPDYVSQYICAHELCHLREFNHSKRFWRLVETLVPDCYLAKKELKTSGLLFY